jgi:hypothetical protein
MFNLTVSPRSAYARAAIGIVDQPLNRSDQNDSVSDKVALASWVARHDYSATISVLGEFLTLSLNTSRRQTVMLGVASSTTITLESVPVRTGLPRHQTNIGLGGLVVRRC